MTIFEHKDTKSQFVANFVTNLIDSFGGFEDSKSQGKLTCILSNNKMFREILRLINKF